MIFFSCRHSLTRVILLIDPSVLPLRSSSVVGFSGLDLVLTFSEPSMELHPSVRARILLHPEWLKFIGAGVGRKVNYLRLSFNNYRHLRSHRTMARFSWSQGLALSSE